MGHELVRHLDLLSLTIHRLREGHAASCRAVIRSYSVGVGRGGFSRPLSGSSLFVRCTFPGFSDKQDKKQ